MSSMLRQHHVRVQDLAAYMRGYDPSKPQSAEDWSKQESSFFEPGMLIFCLEKVSAPSGLALGKKEAEGETYRVKDMCVVVGRDDGKSLVVNITASAFELRYLEVLLLEKARKAILDGKDFQYVAAKPPQPLTDTKVRELEQLGAQYAQGGSRRSLVVDPNGPQEPAMALLQAMGVRLQLGGIGKQLMDIGSICHMLFAPEGRAEDKNKQLVKACFLPLSSEALAAGGSDSSGAQSTDASVMMAAEARKSRSSLPAQPFPNAAQWNSQPGSPWKKDQPGMENAAPPGNATFSGLAASNAPSVTAGQSSWLQQPESAVPPPPVFNDSADAAGLNPFAPPPESRSGDDDFASRFRQDQQGTLGEGTAMRTYEDKFAKEHEAKWGEGLNKFSSEEFGEHHFKTPDFGKKSLSQTRMPAFPQPGSKVSMGGGNPTAGGAGEPGMSAADESLNDDVFQPPYHPSEQSEEGHIPAELKQKLDPNNQLFQDSDNESGNTTDFDADLQQDEQPSPAAFGFDTSSYGSYEKTSMAMRSFADDELEPTPPPPAVPQAQEEEELSQEFSAEPVNSSLPVNVHPDLISPPSESPAFAEPQPAPPVEEPAPPEVAVEPEPAPAEQQQEEPQAEEPAEDKAVSLFERLNQQLSKGAMSADETDFPQAEEHSGLDPFSQMDHEFETSGAPAAAAKSSAVVGDEAGSLEPTNAEFTVLEDHDEPAPATTSSADWPAVSAPEQAGVGGEPTGFATAAETAAPSAKEPVSDPTTSGQQLALPANDFFGAPKQFVQNESSLFGHQSAKFDWAKEAEEEEEKPKPPHLQGPTGIKHLADSLSDLGDFSSSAAKGLIGGDDAKPAQEENAAESSRPTQATDAASQPGATADQTDTAQSAQEEEQAASAAAAQSQTAAIADDTTSTGSSIADIAASVAAGDHVTEQQAPAAPVEVDPKIKKEEAAAAAAADEGKRRRAAFTAAAKPFQEPRLVMNEMATLMSKLEIQVAKAAKKLGSRAEEISERLQNEVDRIVAEAAEAEKENQKSIASLSGRLAKQLDDTSEELRLKISDAAAEGRYKIKQLSSNNQDGIDETKNKLYESLKDACKEFRIDTEELARSTERTLRKLVGDRTIEVNDKITLINKVLDDTSSGYREKLNARFSRFQERMSDEGQSVVASLQRNVHSMVEEIEGSWDRASDKLKSTTLDLEQSIDHTVRAAELNLSQNTRKIMANSLMPRLKANKEKLMRTLQGCNRKFSEESEHQVSNQISGLDSSLNAARQQLQELVEECMNSIDSVGRGQQAGLEEIFKETSAHAERATLEAMEMVKSTETRIVETEAMCKKLAETSSIDTDPQLTEERNTATAKVQALRQKASSELSEAIETGCSQIEHLSHKVQSELSSIRREQIDKARDSADNGISKIKDAIHAAFNAIETAREKYME